ncbi:phosphate signaling complex protein PhoU [Rhodocyclus tenuis]|uniref:Phosphate-specific transport system accessory protein PhoU n=2 Tax=Rhodocyclus TaxID=1064 RepID=A0A6L5JZ19_RHOTE|nr:phosphate signaling complex protein PhoU [Rhodocyclus gracilis]MQY52311.1 phosphate signaling complex protein PhoU [Rhodocyclus gracilis]MRD73899.1 phosphate signaling complex protein PhoU [Rhodocyclus gracilis]NJA89831.1 phosphate signaling complex protein PhoU [Rhodocyclus gracilis]
MNEHTSKNFDLELENLRTRVLQMGGLVEQQVRHAMEGLHEGDTTLLESVIREDHRVNEMENELDLACNQVIAKRQPTAIDLRMIITVLKSISDLERIGDKARKIARLGVTLQEQHAATAPSIELNHICDLALSMLRTALDAFARLDVHAAAETMHLDETVNSEYQAVIRQLITYMMEDPRTISSALDIMAIAKAIERIGDHAKNISEYVVYMVKGFSVRHVSPKEVDEKLAAS